MFSKGCLSWSIGVMLLVASTHSLATAQRTFVSANATDNPNCSIVAPCRSFGAAMNATSSGGEIIVLDSAGYGPVTITKSVSIISPPGIYGGISVASGLNGVTINAPGATVVLRGLSINGQGGNYGILLQQAARVRVENCVVSNMGAVGIYHSAANAEMVVTDTIVRDNTDGFGLVAANASMLLDHVRSEHNTNAGFYVAPTPGSARTRAEIADSLFAENGGNGIWSDSVAGAETVIRVTRSVISGNGQSGFYATAAAASAVITATLTRNSFHSSTAVHALDVLGVQPGQVKAFASDNAFSNESYFYIDGSGSVVHASANAGGYGLYCGADVNLLSFGNNTFQAVYLHPTCTYSTLSGV